MDKKDYFNQKTTIEKTILYIVEFYHIYIWRPFLRQIEKIHIGKWVIIYFRYFCRFLWVFNIVAPPKGEAPCLVYLFIRYPNKFKKFTFKEKVSYLKRFLKSNLKRL